MISLKQFTGQKITAKDDALLYEWLSQNAACVFFGCKVTSLGANQMRITSGRGIILGRTFEVQQEDFTAQLADPGQSWKGRVYIEIDLSNTPQPIAIKTVAAVSLPPLVQENINSDGNIYQFALANYDASDIEASNIKIAFSATPEYYPAAQKLLTPRKIGLANFDGTADITVDQMGAVPKTGGSFSGPVSVNGNFSALGVTRFFSPSYPNLGLTAVGDTDGGIYLGVCDADGAYKTFGVNAKLNAAGKVSVMYKGGGGSSSGSSCRFAFGSKVLTPAEGSYASTLFTSNSLNSLFNTSGEAFSHYNTAVFGVNADYKYNDLRFFITCGIDSDADTWVIRGQSPTQTLPNKPVRVNYLVVTWL